MKAFLDWLMSVDPVFWAAGAVLLTLGVTAWLITKSPKVPGEEKPMTRKEYEENKRRRKERIKSELSDDIGDAILNRMTKGDWTSAEAQHWHLRLGCEFDLKDLLPQRRLSVPEMIVATRTRVATLRKEKRPNIPGEPPSKEIRNFKNPLEAIMAKHFKQQPSTV